MEQSKKDGWYYNGNMYVKSFFQTSHDYSSENHLAPAKANMIYKIPARILHMADGIPMLRGSSLIANDRICDTTKIMIDKIIARITCIEVYFLSGILGFIIRFLPFY